MIIKHFFVVTHEWLKTYKYIIAYLQRVCKGIEVHLMYIEDVCLLDVFSISLLNTLSGFNSRLNIHRRKWKDIKVICYSEVELSMHLCSTKFVTIISSGSQLLKLIFFCANFLSKYNPLSKAGSSLLYFTVLLSPQMCPFNLGDIQLLN